MKGLTHVFVGVGFTGFLMSLFEIPILSWFLGTLVIAPIFSRLPDQDQKIARITFNQVVPHRGKGTHNLLYGLPLILLGFLSQLPIVGFLAVMIVTSVFGALFVHIFVDAFNYGGVWFGIVQIKGFLRWDSFWGNLSFKIVGILLLFLAILSYL